MTFAPHAPGDQSLSWGLVLIAALLAAQGFVVGALLLWVWTTIASDSTGRGEPSAFAAVIAGAGAVATLPLSFRWIRDGVDALLAQPSGLDASPFAALSTELDGPVDVLAAMAGTIRDALDVGAAQIETYPSPGRPSSSGSALRGSWSAGVTATVGALTGSCTEVPLTIAGHDYGILRVTSRPQTRRSGSESDLLRDLARQVALVVSSSVLREELEDSRERLVLAREEERRRIRRDLHDGLGPSLAGIRLQLSALRRQRGQLDSDLETIDEIHRAVGEATAEVRRVVEDLRPPLLDDCGLVDAIRNLHIVPATLVLTVDAPSDMPPLPAAVEVALYRIAVEAVLNTVRHAGATRCAVQLHVGRSSATLTVTDDGCGPPGDARPGVGTSAMAERAGELGGTVSIEGAPDGGTRVCAAVPLRAEGTV